MKRINDGRHFSSEFGNCVFGIRKSNNCDFFLYFTTNRNPPAYIRDVYYNIIIYKRKTTKMVDFMSYIQVYELKRIQNTKYEYKNLNKSSLI